MANYIGIPILILAALLNAAVMPELRIGGGAPDMVFLLVLSWALLADVREALIWAVVGGVLQDVFSIVPLGTSALGLVVVAFTADTLFGHVSRNNFIVPPLAAGAGTVICHLSALMVMGAVGMNVPLIRGLFYVTMPTLLYNIVLIFPVFRMMATVYRWLHPHRSRLE